ncbi:MAG: hypothetical protein ACRDUV_25540 [Pseudonocardiaceae bacterium]
MAPLPRTLRASRVAVATAVGIVALVLAVVLTFQIATQDSASTGTVQPARSTPSRPEKPTSEAVQVETKPYVHRRAHFRVEVPADYRVERRSHGVRLISADQDVVVTVGRGEQGGLRAAGGALQDTLKQSYDKVRVLGTQRNRVDGRPALISSGRAANSAGVAIRFVTVTVQHRPRAYALTAFTAMDSDPSQVLPRVNAVVNGFEVLPGH